MLNHNLVWYGYSEIFFFVKHLKKILTCIWNFVNIHSEKEEDFLGSTWRKFLSVFEICEYLFRKRGGFFVKRLKKIAKCIWNLWISIPQKRVDFSWSAWRNFLSVLRICEYPLPKKRRNIMYYYYIFSLRVGGRVFFSPLFVAITWRQFKKRHVIHTKDFFFWKESPKFAKFWGKNNLKLSYSIGCGQNIASFQNV
jgi:hypothetical protein